MKGQFAVRRFGNIQLLLHSEQRVRAAEHAANLVPRQVPARAADFLTADEENECGDGAYAQ